MNTKNNQRSRDTDERIIRAVYAAITEEHRPLDRITVRAVCETVGINRSTFYAHFQDVYDVVERTERSMGEKIALSALEAVDEGAPLEGVFERVFAFVGEHRAFYHAYLGVMHRSEVIGVAWDLLSERTNRLRFDQLGFRSQAEMEYMGVFFFHGLSAMLHQWIENGCRESPREMVDLLVRLYRPA